MEKNKKTKTNKTITKKTTNKKNNNTKTKKNVIKENLTNDKNYKLAEKYYKNKDYLNAYQEYLKLSEIYPKNKKIYKRLIESLTKEFTYKENTRDFKTAFDDYVTTYKILATKKELTLIEKKLNEYKKVKPIKSKSKFLLIALLGFLGIHKFLEKKYITGIIYLFTLGLFGIGVIVDLINDYVEFECDKQVDIFRYIIAFIILLFSLLRLNTNNFYYFIIIAIIITPIVYSKILKLIPNLIKIIAIIVLCYLGFKVTPIVDYVPTNILGTWITDNENTNFKSIKIKLDKSTVKFSDREKESGNNEYDSTNKILKIYISDTNVYKFKIDLENNEICTYNDSKKCIISFKKQVEEK